MKPEHVWRPGWIFLPSVCVCLAIFHLVATSHLFHIQTSIRSLPSAVKRLLRSAHSDLPSPPPVTTNPVVGPESKLLLHSCLESNTFVMEGYPFAQVLRNYILYLQVYRDCPLCKYLIIFHREESIRCLWSGSGIEGNHRSFKMRCCLPQCLGAD